MRKPLFRNDSLNNNLYEFLSNIREKLEKNPLMKESLKNEVINYFQESYVNNKEEWDKRRVDIIFRKMFNKIKKYTKREEIECL